MKDTRNVLDVLEPEGKNNLETNLCVNTSNIPMINLLSLSERNCEQRTKNGTENSESEKLKHRETCKL